jgi:hypothetical protein
MTRIAESFAEENGLEQVEVRVELADGSRHLLASVSAEPGFGFLSLVPHRSDGDEPRRLIIPVGMLRTIEISPPDAERPFGFAGTVD